MMETDVLTMENVVTQLRHVEIIVRTMESGEKFLQYRGVTFQVGLLGLFTICNSPIEYS